MDANTNVAKTNEQLTPNQEDDTVGADDQQTIIYADYIGNGSTPSELREIADRLEELEALGCEIEESTSHETTLGWRVTTDDVRIAARFEFPWMTEPDEDGDYPEYIEWCYSEPYGVETAEYHEGDEATDEYFAAVKAQVAAEREQQEAEQADRARQYAEAQKAEWDALVAEVPTMDLHPYLRAKIEQIVATPLPPTSTMYPEQWAIGQKLQVLKTVRAGIVNGVADGKCYEIHSGNIGGKAVDHLRENGLIGMVEGRVLWAPGTSQEAYKRATKAAREFYRPSEVYDTLQRAAVTA